MRAIIPATQHIKRLFLHYRVKPPVCSAGRSGIPRFYRHFNPYTFLHGLVESRWPTDRLQGDRREHLFQGSTNAGMALSHHAGVPLIACPLTMDITAIVVELAVELGLLTLGYMPAVLSLVALELALYACVARVVARRLSRRELPLADACIDAVFLVVDPPLDFINTRMARIFLRKYWAA